MEGPFCILIFSNSILSFWEVTINSKAYVEGPLPKLESQNKRLNAKELKSKFGIGIPSIKELERTLDAVGITERKQYLALPLSEELRRVTKRSIADLFINYGLATSDYFSVFKDRVYGTN